MANFNPLQLALKPLLEQAMKDDELFAQEIKEKEARTEKPKSWEECCEYILGEAYEYASKHKSGNMGMAGMSDTDLTDLIKHYYDEDEIKIKAVSGASAKVAKVDTAKTEKVAGKGQETQKKEEAKKPAEQKPAKKAKKEDEGQFDLFSEEFWKS